MREASSVDGAGDEHRLRGVGGVPGDPPLAMALLDWIVDGAIILKIAGQSYRHTGRSREKLLTRLPRAIYSNKFSTQSI
jgi:hypothetical protein